MKRILTKAAMALAFLAGATSASADVQVHLTEQFESGATFDGVLTFSDGFAGLNGVAGTLSGGNYGVNPINWTWRHSFGDVSGSDVDGNLATYEDWLMSGPVQTANIPLYTPFIGISWTPSTDGVLHLTLNSSAYYTGISTVNSSELATGYTVTAVPEPTTYGMLLAGLGLLGFVARRKNRA